MGRRKKGRCVRKNKQLSTEEKEEVVRAPHSFVIHKGLTGYNIGDLTKDFRKVMEPFTATALKERKKNAIKDFVSVAGLLHVSHLCIFSRTETGMYLKICRLPRGPTLTFRISNFCLARDIISLTKKQFVFEEAFKHSPLIVLNNFSGEGTQMKLMASMFQNMFPKISLTTVNLSNIRRCVCLNYNPTTKLIDFRHYVIKVVPVGLSKSVKKLVQAKIPNLSRCEDFSDFMAKSAMSESEAEDDPVSHVTLPQKLSSRGNHEKGTSAIRLYEVGPRLTLQLIKIESGLLDGNVLFHELVQKTDEEKKVLEKKREQKKKLKEKRKKVQQENTKKKEALKEAAKEKSLQGIKRKRENEVLIKKYAQESCEQSKIEEDDDAQYYRDEIGEEPEEELFQAAAKTGPRIYAPRYKVKKPKTNDDQQNSVKQSFTKDKAFKKRQNFSDDKQGFKASKKDFKTKSKPSVKQGFIKKKEFKGKRKPKFSR